MLEPEQPSELQYSRGFKNRWGDLLNLMCMRYIHLWEGSSTYFQYCESLLQLSSTLFSKAGCLREAPISSEPPCHTGHGLTSKGHWTSISPLKSLDHQEVTHSYFPIPEGMIIILSFKVCMNSSITSGRN